MTSGVKGLNELTAEERKEFVDKYDTFIFDIDGTLCLLAGGVIPVATRAISSINSREKEMLVITDNCMYSRENVFSKLNSVFPEFKKENVLTSAWILVQHMKKIGVKGKIYVIGEEKGIIHELKNEGYEVVYDRCEEMRFEQYLTLKLEEGVGAVVLGLDSNYSLQKIIKAINHLSNPSVHFFVTHKLVFGEQNKLTLPACGALVLPIQTSCGRDPVYSGKGSQMVVDYVHSLGYDMKRCLFVGDMFITDIVCGNMCGMDTLLVTGCSWNHLTLEEVVKGSDPLLVPTYLAESVADLGKLFSNTHL